MTATEKRHLTFMPITWQENYKTQIAQITTQYRLGAAAIEAT